MKAIQVPRLGPADVLEYADVPTPRPGREQVLVKIAAASVNYIDVLLRNGAYPIPRGLPFIPGDNFPGSMENLSP